MTPIGTRSRTLVVAGHGMVGHRLVEELVEREATRRWRVVVVGEEPRAAYDRVHLTSLFEGATPDDLSLVSCAAGTDPGVEMRTGERVLSIDRGAATVRTDAGTELAYDALVLATGSAPFVPPVPGREAQGCFVYRTVEDVEAIKADASGRRVGAVVGGGLLGLEAAGALRSLGLETHVVEFAPRLMPVQVDDGGGGVLRRCIEDLGVAVHTAAETTEISSGDDGRVRTMHFADGTELAVDLIVFSAGIRPRDELARDAGLEIGERGGVVVDDTLQTSDPRIFAIGECASHQDRVYGLVAPGYEMARVLADRLCDGDTEFPGADLSTQLKLLGVDVAAFGDAHGLAEGAESIVLSDPVSRVYKRLVLTEGGTRVAGGILVGDASAYPMLVAMARGDLPTPEVPAQLLVPAGATAAAMGGLAALPGTTTICNCNNVTKDRLLAAIEEGADDVPALKACTLAGTGCGGCVPLVTELIDQHHKAAGIEVRRTVCEHFDHTRQELFDIVRVKRITSFGELLDAHGQGLGCEVCKPAVASMLASMGSGYILDGEQASLQDTNDHFLANLQRNGTYSVVPRVPGGEITPDQLVALGEVAKEYGLYTKITGAQRIDLFGARVEQLPGIWARIVDAGMESGHAYGKALRTVKSCVGETWCRYGVQDSVGLAVALELRYRGLRAPHKIKCAVSGCTRECAEAQGKDVGVIATEKGWNLFVCGNGGMRPQHAVLFTEDLDTETLFRLVDRFLMFYVRTADRLERTATWLNKLDGGVDYLRRVLIDDDLGICADLEAEMARHVETYECEWKATLEDPDRLKRFRSFVNSDEPDPSIVFVRERGQIRPAPVGIRS